MTTAQLVSPSALARSLRADPARSPLGDDRWRVTRADGSIVGYIDRSTDGPGQPFHARRLMASQRVLAPVGDFWTLDDALAALG